MAGPTSRISSVCVVGPLGPFADVYRAKLGEQEYTPLTVVNQLRQLAGLSRWLETNRVSVEELTSDRLDEFTAFQRGRGRGRCVLTRPALGCLLDVLGAAGVPLQERTVVVSPTQRLLSRFERHLLSERGLAAGTVRGYVDHTERFLSGRAQGCGLAQLTAAEVTAAVLRVSSAGVSVSAAQNFVAALRSFLRFCFIDGLVDTDLSQAALPVTGRRRSLLPAGITRSDADALLGSCDRRSALGRRDYAVVVVLLRLGLRRSELADLRLDDIDWRAGEVVVRGKGARSDRLPLPADVGEAIAEYLRRGRPASDRREVFLRARAPFNPIASGTVASTVRRACRRAGIAEIGSHRLRHTAACEMVSAGVALVEIAQVLRHHSLQSTAVYARVDIERLRTLAAPWPCSATGSAPR